MATRGSRVLAGLLVVVAVLGVLGSPTAMADSIDDKKKSVDSQIADLKSELEGASQDLVDSAVELQKLQNQLSDARASLAAAQAARAEAAHKDAEIGARLDFAEAQLTKANTRSRPRSQRRPPPGRRWAGSPGTPTSAMA